MTFTEAAREVVSQDVAILGPRRVARMLACDHTTVWRWMKGTHGSVMSDLLDAVVTVYGYRPIVSQMRQANGVLQPRRVQMTVPDRGPGMVPPAPSLRRAG